MSSPGTSPIDRAFIETNQLIERYLEGKLPYKGQRELESWCRANPEYLKGLHLSQRTMASLKLLEASGMPQDLAEPRIPWWKKPQALALTAAVAAAALLACAVLVGKLNLARGRVEDAQRLISRGTLEPPASMRNVRLQPDRAEGVNSAKLVLDRHVPQLVEVALDMSYSVEKRFRITIDKRDQARLLVLGGETKDSNGDLNIFAQAHDRRRIHHAPRRQRAAHAHQQGAADEADDPHPGSKRVLQREQRRASTIRRRSRRTAARVPERNPSAREFRGDALQHRAAARSQRAQHRALVAALVARRLHRREQHDDARRQREQEHVLHGERGAIHDVADLLEDGIDVEHRHGRKLAHQVDQRGRCAGVR
jgi:hypothetical protein